MEINKLQLHKTEAHMVRFFHILRYPDRVSNQDTHPPKYPVNQSRTVWKSLHDFEDNRSKRHKYISVGF